LGDEQQARRGRRRFSDEFKRDAVEIVRTCGKSIAEVARELGIYDSSLGNWVRQDEVNRGERDGLSSDDSHELSELRRENARLRMERELLKRAVAFWVRESNE
jgi:transposase-like protein